MITSETFKAIPQINVSDIDPEGSAAAFLGYAGESCREYIFPGGWKMYATRKDTRLDRVSSRGLDRVTVKFLDEPLEGLGREAWDAVPEFAAMWRRIWDLQEVLEAMAEAHRAQVKAILGF